MMKLPPLTLEQLDARLRAHALEMASLQAAFDIQTTRIAQMQAELDVLPQARKRRLLQSKLVIQPSHTGNGHQN